MEIFEKRTIVLYEEDQGDPDRKTKYRKTPQTHDGR